MGRVVVNSAGSSRLQVSTRSNLILRLLTAAVGIPVVVVLNAFGGIPFAVAVGIVAAAAAFELVRVLESGGYRPLLLLVVPTSACMAVVPMFVGHFKTAWIGCIVAALFLAGAYYLLPHAFRHALMGWTLTVFAVVYVGLLLGHLTALREVRHGAAWVLLVLIMTWGYDTGAFLAGSRYGRRPFMQHVSPSKTLEGVGGGLLASTLLALIGIATLHLLVWQALLLGAATGVAAQIGDLVESMMKRQTGVKDSGAIVPGHGGLLDRIDSLLFTVVLGYYGAALMGYVT